MPSLKRSSQRTSTCIGIDPGQTGGIVLIVKGRVQRAWSMPSTLQDLYRCLSSIQKDWGETSLFCLVEQVGVFPGQGISSSSKFMRHVGNIEMALTAAKIPFSFVMPRVWQKAMGVTTRKKRVPRRKIKNGPNRGKFTAGKGAENKNQFKKRLKQKAQSLMPGFDWTLNTCDAGMIALYCYQTHRE